MSLAFSSGTLPINPLSNLPDSTPQLSRHFTHVIYSSDKLVQKAYDSPHIVLDAPTDALDPMVFGTEDDWDPNEKRAWLFRINPNHHNIERAVRKLNILSLEVRQNAATIKKGDLVYLWKGGQGSCLLASGVLTSAPSVVRARPTMRPFSFLPDQAELRVNVRVEAVLPKPVDKFTCQQHPILCTMKALRAPVGTNFKISKAHAETMQLIVEEVMGQEYPMMHLADPATSCLSCHLDVRPDCLISCSTCDAQHHNFCLSPQLTKVPKHWSCPRCTSILTKNCILCRGGENETEILMCDCCDEAFHMYCLPEPLKEIPEGFWFCPSCGLTDQELRRAKMRFALNETQVEASRLLVVNAVEACQSFVKVLRDKRLTDTARQEKLLRVAQRLARYRECVSSTVVRSFNAWTQKLIGVRLLDNVP